MFLFYDDVILDFYYCVFFLITVYFLIQALISTCCNLDVLMIM